METKIELRLDTRSRLLKAAITVFAKFGYAGSSLRQIADLADVNHSSVKHHYKNKDDLWKKAVSYLFGLMEEFVTKDEDSYQNMSPRDVIITMTRNYIIFSAEHPEIAKIRMLETIHESDRLDWMTKHYLNPLTERAIRGIEEGQKMGVYTNEMSATHLHHINNGAVRSLYLIAPELKSTLGIDVFSHDYIEEHISAVLKIMLVDPVSQASGELIDNSESTDSSDDSSDLNHGFGSRIF